MRIKSQMPFGICTSHSLPLGILDANREENSMTKNLRFGFVAYNAILSRMLAKRGFIGPVRIVEGDSGERLFDTVWNVENLDDMSKLTRLMVLGRRMENIGSSGSVEIRPMNRR